MAIPITIPRLGWNMEEGVFGGWLKRDGDHIRAGEMIFCLESEKATEEIECLDAGILRIAVNSPKQGDTVGVGAVIGYLVQGDEAAPEVNVPKAVEPVAPTVPIAVHKTETPHAIPETQSPANTLVAAAPAISPRARRVAKELGIDWTTIRGSGRTGRIREADVRAAAPANGGGAPITLMRKTIAERMVSSHRDTAPVTLTTSADASNLVNLRNQFKTAKQAVPSYNDLLIKLSAFALQKHPALNARWEIDRIVLIPGIHIGIAVDTEAGLVVPVIRDVPSLGIKQIASQSIEMIERARRRKLSAGEMQGGTFTITNLGAIGVDAFTPIINYPECAILGVGRILRQPWVLDEQVVIRDRISLSLTFDHRIVDGAPAARFLQTLTQAIENPTPLLIQ